MHAADDFVLTRIDHGDANLSDDGRGAVALTGLEKRFDDLLRGAKIFAVGTHNPKREGRSLIPICAFEIKIEEQLGLFAALIKIGGMFKEFRCLRELALGGEGTGLYDRSGQAICIDLQRLVGELIGFGLITTGKGALGGGNIGVDCLARLPHGLIKICQANLNAEIVRLREEKFFKKTNGFGLAVVLEMDFSKLQEERASFAHDPLLDVQVGQLFKGANLFRGKLGDAFVNGNGLGEKTVADKDLREALEVIDGLKSLTLADVEFADGHEGDLIARLKLENLLVFGDGLRDFALVEQLLRGFDKFALAIGHSCSQTISVLRLPEDISSAQRSGRQTQDVLANASRPGKGKSTNPGMGVSSQLSPLGLGN